MQCLIWLKQETERLDSRFLEPACGDGNFLIEVLNRKLEILVKKYKKNQYEFEKNSIVVYWFNIWSRYS